VTLVSMADLIGVGRCRFPDAMVSSFQHSLLSASPHPHTRAPAASTEFDVISGPGTCFQPC
jgi:hypothetical protein